ncbi:MAG: sigma-70 family RNA polymerase sigma factor [Thermoguttaceae bacterium]
MPSDRDSSFVALFVKNQRRIYGYLLTIVPDCNEADDLFQQTSLVLWEKAGEFRPDGDFARWACGIAFNLVRNWRAKKRRDRHYFSDEMMARIADARAERSAWLEDSLLALGICVDGLVPAERRLLDLCYSGDRSIRQASDELGHSQAAVYQRLHRIRTRLMECVQRNAAEAEGRSP